MTEILSGQTFWYSFMQIEVKHVLKHESSGYVAGQTILECWVNNE